MTLVFASLATTLATVAAALTIRLGLRRRKPLARPELAPIPGDGAPPLRCPVCGNRHSPSQD